MKKPLLALALTTAVLATATPAVAQVVTGDTTGDPTYNRLFTLTSLSGAGTAVPYESSAFTVSSAGSYSFLLTATSFDSFLTLYSGNFDPADARTNAVALNDDLTTLNLRQSGFTQALTAGTSYFAVATGFANTDFGRYTLSVAGPGVVTFGAAAPGAVPEPASWAMMLFGFGGMGAAMRRRKKVTTRVQFA